MFTLQCRARWLLGFCKEQNRKRCSPFPSETRGGAARDILFGSRIVFVCRARMNHRGATISVAAQAQDFHFASHALAVVAAVFLLFGGEAGTGHIRAFLGAKHRAPLSVHPESIYPGALDIKMPNPTQEIVAQTADTYERNRKIGRTRRKAIGLAASSPRLSEHSHPRPSLQPERPLYVNRGSATVREGKRPVFCASQESCYSDTNCAIRSATASGSRRMAMWPCPCRVETCTLGKVCCSARVVPWKGHSGLSLPLSNKVGVVSWRKAERSFPSASMASSSSQSRAYAPRPLKSGFRPRPRREGR